MRKIIQKLHVVICLLLVCSMFSGCSLSTPGKFIKGFVGYYTEDQDEDEDEDEDDDRDKKKKRDEDEDEESKASKETESSSEEVESKPSTEVVQNPTVADGEYAQTIMVYMVGSDLESQYGNATLDLEEMMAAGADTEHNNIVVYTGGASEWKINELSADKNAILMLEKDKSFGIVETTDALNMGEADTLSTFINYCFDNYESETYSLVLWNHGAGPVYGFGVDENYKDLLTMDEMKKAFEDSVGARGARFEWVGFDACIMNSLEVADLLAPYANYMIASQETEPGWGWDYAFLSETSNEILTGEQMGRSIIDSYMQYSEQVFDMYPRLYCDLTMSCIDLNKYQATEDALDSCFNDLDAGLTVENYPELVRNRENTRSFATYASNFDYGMVDAVHLLNQIAPDSSTADTAINAIEEMVVYSRSNMRNANGISICYPYSSSAGYADACVATQEGIDFSPEYTGFLKKFYAIQNGEPITTEWDFSEAETTVVTVEAETEADVDTSDISLQLTEEQQANFAKADFYILAKVEDAGYADVAADDPRGDEMYMFVHLGKDVTLDENGVLHGYYGNQVMYVHDKTEDVYSNIPMILLEQERTEEEVRYTCGVVLNNWNIAEVEDWVTEAANLQIVVNDEYPNGIIRSAIPIADEDETNPSKQLLDLEEFGILEVFARASYITRGENGEMLNFYEWEESGWMLGFDQDLQNEYELVMRPLENPENYVCVFRIKDAQGNVSYSELIPLK